jgi:aryl-alcohol dehydrogenase-like predicted oxidoreductase
MSMSGTYGAVDEAKSLETVAAALDAGITLLDTSDMYGAGHNEELVGKAIRGRRDEVVLATKFGQVLDEKGNAVGVNGRPEYVRRAFEASVRRLGVDEVDLYIAHRIDPQVPIEDTVGEMAALVTEGKVRHIGLSEASTSTIRRAHAVHPIAAVQTEYSLWWRGVEADIYPTCRELGIGFIAYSPLGRGLLTGAIRDRADIPEDDSRRRHPRFDEQNLETNVRFVDAVRRVARDKGCSPSQLALAWLLSRGEDIVPIPGTTRREHLLQNVAAIDIHLDADDLARIESAAQPGSSAGDRYPAAALARVGI